MFYLIAHDLSDNILQMDPLYILGCSTMVRVKKQDRHTRSMPSQGGDEVIDVDISATSRDSLCTEIYYRSEVETSGGLEKQIQPGSWR